MWTVFWPFLTPTPSSPMWTEVDFQHTHPKSHPMKICLNYNFFRINKTKNNGYGIKELFIKVIFPCSKGTFFSIVHILDILIHTWSMCTQGRRNRWNRWSTCFTGNQRLSKVKQSNRQEKKYVGYYFFWVLHRKLYCSYARVNTYSVKPVKQSIIIKQLNACKNNT